MDVKRYPLIARLKSVSKLPLKRRFTSNFELLDQNKVLFVDSKIQDLKPGVKLEGAPPRPDHQRPDGPLPSPTPYPPGLPGTPAPTARPHPPASAPPPPPPPPTA